MSPRLNSHAEAIQALGIEPEVRPQCGQQVTRYRPTLALSAADGQTRQESIADFVRQDQAEALVGWLRTHLDVAELPLAVRRIRGISRSRE